MTVPSKRSIGVFVALPLLWVFSGLPAACILTRRPRSVEAEKPPSINVENLQLTTHDGETIGAWWLPPSSSDVAVILLHGHRGSRTRNPVPLNWLANEGHGALSLSVRCHGDSTCNNGYDVGYSASHDVIAAVDWLSDRAPELRVFVWGRSMGAATGLFAAPTVGAQVDGWILESPYGDLETAIRNRLRMKAGPFGALAYPPLSWWGQLFLPVSVDDVAPVKAAALVGHGRFLVLGGTADKRATIGEVRAVCEALRGYCELIEFLGGHHSGLWSKFGDDYRDAIVQFLRCPPVEGPPEATAFGRIPVGSKPMRTPTNRAAGDAAF